MPRFTNAIFNIKFKKTDIDTEIPSIKKIIAYFSLACPLLTMVILLLNNVIKIISFTAGYMLLYKIKISRIDEESIKIID